MITIPADLQLYERNCQCEHVATVNTGLRTRKGSSATPACAITETDWSILAIRWPCLSCSVTKAATDTNKGKKVRKGKVMLVLKRNKDESIVISTSDGEIRLMITEASGLVGIGIEAPRTCNIRREEVISEQTLPDVPEQTLAQIGGR